MTEKQKITLTKEPEKEQSKRGRKAGSVPFPRDPLKKVLTIPEAIWTQNAGNPFSILDLAPAVNQSPTSSSFVRQLASCYRYGLTEGSPTTKVISLTPLGRSIVAPTVDDDVNASLRKALTHPESFNKFYSTFNEKPIPRKEILKNTLVNPPESGGFGIPREDVEEFIKIVMQNITDYGLAQDIQEKTYLRLDKLSAEQVTKPITGVETEGEEGTVGMEEKLLAEVSQEVKPRVFISHSKNMKILDQIKQMLNFGEFEYEVAVERETTAIPIPEKIFGLMRKCNCAVINVSADKQEKHDDDSYGVNQNVLVEIGAAFLQYNKKVILLVDKRVKLPSNLQGLYTCYYEGDELSWEIGMKLQKALTEFRSAKASPDT